MKILVLSNLYPPDVIGGYELGCKQVVDALRGRGHDVLVLTTAPRTPALAEGHVARDFQLSEVWNHYLFVHNSPITSHLLQAQSGLVNALNVHVLARVVERFQPDVVYVWNLVGVGGVGLMAAVQHLGLPWVWHLMDHVPVELCQVGGARPPALVHEINRQLTGRFLACSRQLVDEVEAAGIRLESRVEVVPNWVVGPQPAPRTRTYRAGAGDPLRIMSAGQINRNKGIDILIEAAALVRERGFDRFTIDLYGHAEDPAFQALSRFRGLERQIRFCGTRSQADLVQHYAEHDLFAFPTWAREPFAFAPLEASWQGCVPLMSQTGGNAEWFVSGVHCLKAERNPAAFADALVAVLNGATDLAPIAQRAAAVVGRDFHLDALIPRVEVALVQAAAAPRRPGKPTAELYRLALLAEKLAQVFLSELVPAA